MDLGSNFNRIVVLIIAIAIILLIIRPFFGVLAFAALLAYLMYPTYRKMSKKLTEGGAAILITCATLIIVVLGAYYGINIILNETAKIYLFIAKLPLDNLSPTLEGALSKFVSQSISSLSDILYRLPQYALSLFVFFISLFYFLKDGDKIAEWIINLLPLKEARKKSITLSVKNYVSAFVHVQLVIGLLQGVIAGVGFYIFGLPYPLLAGIAAGVLSILPLLGTSLLYLPAGILVALQGNVQSGIGILIYGLLLASLLDNILRPYLIGRRAQVHPLVIFVGILGGISLLGFIGIFVGPILLSMTIVVLKEVYEGITGKT